DILVKRGGKMNTITMSEYLTMQAEIRKRCASYLKEISIAQTKESASIIDRMDRLIERRERYKEICGTNLGPTYAQTVYWLELWHRNFKNLESKAISLVQSNEKMEKRIKILVTESVAFLMQKAALEEDEIINADIKGTIESLISQVQDKFIKMQKNNI
ncbi:MAG: hypothetical protein K2J20_02090, partial [Bacilli bacterium]|nr:hypothetical protein [Bacilli bacterium]